MELIDNDYHQIIEPTKEDEVIHNHHHQNIIEHLSFLVIEGETNRLTDSFKQMLIHAIDACSMPI